MKRSIILIITIMFVSQGNATNIPLDSIKAKIVSFYNENTFYKGRNISIDYFPNFMIRDRTQGEIEEGKEGVFSFGLLASGETTHLVLVEKDSAEILNMLDPVDENILYFLYFWKEIKDIHKKMHYFISGM